MTDTIDAITHPLVIVAGIAAVTALAINGNVSGTDALVVIAGLLGLSGGSAASRQGAQQALALPAAPMAAPTVSVAPTAPTAANPAPLVEVAKQAARDMTGGRVDLGGGATPPAAG